jgi:hypothetical protein
VQNGLKQIVWALGVFSIIFIHFLSLLTNNTTIF